MTWRRFSSHRIASPAPFHSPFVEAPFQAHSLTSAAAVTVTWARASANLQVPFFSPVIVEQCKCKLADLGLQQLKFKRSIDKWQPKQTNWRQFGKCKSPLSPPICDHLVVVVVVIGRFVFFLKSALTQTRITMLKLWYQKKISEIYFTYCAKKASNCRHWRWNFGGAGVPNVLDWLTLGVFNYLIAFRCQIKNNRKTGSINWL